MKKLSVALLMVLSLVRPVAAQTIAIPGGSQIGGWGVGGIQSVGQTFTALNSRLDKFSFWLKAEAGPPFTFGAYIFQWDDANLRATGPALFVGFPNASPPPLLPNHVPYSFLPGATLTTNGRYIAFLSVVGTLGLLASVESSLTDAYADGAFVSTNAPPFSPWSTSAPPRDLRFEANFSSVVPEPSAVVLLAVGLVGVGLAVRRRRIAP